MPIPSELSATKIPALTTHLPRNTAPLNVDKTLPTLIYNAYNLDPKWREGDKANRVLLLEPSVFARFPMADNTLSIILELAKNIENVQVFVGEFAQLQSLCDGGFFYKEHPLNCYQGIEDSRDWMFDVSGYYPSFFAFWKQCKKQMKVS